MRQLLLKIVEVFQNVKKFISLAVVLTLVLAMAIPAMAAGVANIDKKAFDGFAAQKLSANNKITGLGDFELVSDSKAGWRLLANNKFCPYVN